MCGVKRKEEERRRGRKHREREKRRKGRVKRKAVVKARKPPSPLAPPLSLLKRPRCTCSHGLCRTHLQSRPSSHTHSLTSLSATGHTPLTAFFLFLSSPFPKREEEKAREAAHTNRTLVRWKMKEGPRKRGKREKKGVKRGRTPWRSSERHRTTRNGRLRSLSPPLFSCLFACFKALSCTLCRPSPLPSPLPETHIQPLWHLVLLLSHVTSFIPGKKAHLSHALRPRWTTRLGERKRKGGEEGGKQKAHLIQTRTERKEEGKKERKKKASFWWLAQFKY